MATKNKLVTLEVLKMVNDRMIDSSIKGEASGAIASFKDGSDGVEMKSIVVNIEPIQEGTGDPSPDNVRPITGRTSLNITRCRKNLLPTRTTEGTNHGITYTPIVENGLVTGVRAYGTQDGNASVLNLMPGGTGIILPPGNYILSGGSDTVYLLLRRDTSGGTTIAESKNDLDAAFQIEQPTLVFCNARKTGYSGEIAEKIVYPMIRKSDVTDNTFEPCQGNIINIDWTTEAGTVYGGTLDVVTGVLTVDRAIVDLGTLTWDLRTTGLYRSSIIDDIKLVSSQADVVQGIAENYQVFKYSYAEAHLDEFVIGMNQGEKRIFVSGGAAGTGKFVYALATPQTYQLTPQQIRSLLGENNVFADSGNTAIRYTADTKLYIDNKIAELQAIVLENT